jgi:hypothetical protein
MLKNTSNLQYVTGQPSERTLGSRIWQLGLVCARTSHLDVAGRESLFLASDGHVLGGKHGSVRRRFVAISLDLHAAIYSHHGLSSREIWNHPERSETWTKVSLKEAKMWATTIISSPSLVTGKWVARSSMLCERSQVWERGKSVNWWPLIRNGKPAGILPMLCWIIGR